VRLVCLRTGALTARLFPPPCEAIQMCMPPPYIADGTNTFINLVRSVRPDVLLASAQCRELFYELLRENLLLFCNPDFLRVYQFVCFGFLRLAAEGVDNADPDVRPIVAFMAFMRLFLYAVGTRCVADAKNRLCFAPPAKPADAREPAKPEKLAKHGKPGKAPTGNKGQPPSHEFPSQPVVDVRRGWEREPIYVPETLTVIVLLWLQPPRVLLPASVVCSDNSMAIPLTADDLGLDAKDDRIKMNPMPPTAAATDERSDMLRRLRDRTRMVRRR
jgi:hypothetical protein